ncbi:MAG: hypothetical protein U1F77_19360 [Kiritimatiellia bacterium]
MYTATTRRTSALRTCWWIDPGTRWSANEGNDRCRVESVPRPPGADRAVPIDERAWNRVSKFNFQYQAGDD